MKIEPVQSIGELSRLDSGDACLVGNGPDGPMLVGIEVKSITDLVSSISTGRLQGTQVPLMLKSYDVCWLLYYGKYRAGPGGGLDIRYGKTWRRHKIGNREVPYGYVEAMLLDLAAVGFKIKHVHDIHEAAAWIGVLFRWWTKPWAKHHGMHVFDNSREVSLMPGMDDSTHLRARIAAQLPGVGFERAVSAAQHFKSVSGMVNAEVGEWTTVPGIGKVIAKAIVEAVR